MHFVFLVCPEGFYGEHCMRSCQCASPNFVCQATDGCVCRKGFSGENCDLTKAEQHIQEAERDSKYWKLNGGCMKSLFTSIESFI